MVRTFVKAVLVGILAAAIVPTIFLFLIALLVFGESGTSAADLFWIVSLPTLIAATFVIPATALLGLPLTWALARTGREREGIYTAAGAILGGTIIVAVALVFELRGMWWAIALGSFSGGVTGWDWGRSRAAMQE